MSTTQNIQQQTLTEAITLTGIGLHSGAALTLRLLPADADQGLIFIRSDLPAGENRITLTPACVVDTRLCTVIGNEHGARISTTEHLLSALAGLGIDNCTVEIDGPEIPAMDGSAAPFVAAILETGITQQSQPRRVLEILRPVSVQDGGRMASLQPAALSEWQLTLDYERLCPFIGRQSAAVTLSPETFASEIAPARSFTVYAELEAVWATGLGRGGSLDNNILVWGDVVANRGGLRFANEFARHKLLDAIGDLALAGGAIQGRYEAFATGHALNNQLLRAVFADPANYRWITTTAA